MQREDQDGETFEYSIADENMTAQPEMACTTKETQEMVQELIGSLSDEQRMCVLMFHIEGYSIKRYCDSSWMFREYSKVQIELWTEEY